MSMMTPEQAALRAAAAGEMQEIAIFNSSQTGMVNAVFERTVITQHWIARGSPKLIGVYGESDSYYEILKELRKCLRQHSPASV